MYTDATNRHILLSEERSEPAYGNYDGDQIYGIAPVKLALSAGRRNITELLLQSNMELSQKKVEDSVRVIIALAQKLGVSTREFSKHDLNMLSDNRPVQRHPLTYILLRYMNVCTVPHAHFIFSFLRR